MNYIITLLRGDGIGPEIIEEAKLLLEDISMDSSFKFTFQEGLIGHSAIEKTGNPLPDETIQLCKQSSAFLLGAVGHPIYDNDPSAKVRPEQGLLKIRKELGLFANLRPVKVFPQLAKASTIKEEVVSGVDILFFRELTGDVYFGTPRYRSEDGKEAVDTMRYYDFEVERIARLAFEAAKARKGKLCSVDKANVLESSRLWREVVKRVALDYPEVETTHLFVDNMAMQLIRAPKDYDVVLTGNLFGDILTDEAAQLTGSLGMLASASMGAEVGLFEPAHGSAPDIAGQNKANPLATFLSVALMLDRGLGLTKEAKKVENAIEKTLEEGWRTMDIADEETPKEKLIGTQKMGELVRINL